MNPADNLKFDSKSNTLHIDKIDGIVFTIGGKPVSGSIKLTRNTTVHARERGRLIDADADREWTFKVSENESTPAESEDSSPNEVEDTPPAPTAGNTPQAPQQTTGGPAGGTPPTPGPRPPRP